MIEHARGWTATATQLLPPAPRYRETITTRRALATAALAFVGGSVCAFPLYGALWWWDILTHSVGGGAIATIATLRYRGWWYPSVVVAYLALGWELAEQLVPQEWLGIAMVVADWRSDLAVSILAGVVVAVALSARMQPATTDTTEADS